MSWLRSAVSRAVEAGGQNSVTRTVKGYAGAVAQHAGQAVAGGARIIQDRVGTADHKSFRLTLKSLEDLAVSCRGLERVELLKKWLVELKEASTLAGFSLANENFKRNVDFDVGVVSTFSATNSRVFHRHSDLGVEMMNFRDVFLQSQALEGLIMSVILETPDEEEVNLLLGIFEICLTGGKEVHNAILSSIQDLSNSFTKFQDEVLVKREEMLQFAQGAISGLKVSADMTRIDAEVSILQQKVDYLVELLVISSENYRREPDKATPTAMEVLKEAVAQVQLCSKLEALLLDRRSINTGDTPEIHSMKIDKLKVLAESLANCSLKAERRISDHRRQREEAINYRLAKAKEVIEIEKELSDEISALENKRDELEEELKKVNTSLTTSVTRLKKTREERDQFDEASNQILIHLKTKEDELTKSILSCKVEFDVVHTWMNFLEDTWGFQTSYIEQKKKQMNDQLERCGSCFLKLANHHMRTCKEILGATIGRIRTYAYNLKNFNGRSEMMSNAHGVLSTESSPRKFLEEEYLETEAKIISIFSVIADIKKLLFSDRGIISRGDYTDIDELNDDVDRMKLEFESIERPTLELETPRERIVTRVVKKMQKTSSYSPSIMDMPSTSSKLYSKSAVISTEHLLDLEADVAKLEAEFGRMSKDHSSGEIISWEFDGI